MRAIERCVVPASAIVAHASALAAGFVWLDHAHIEARAAIAPPAEWPRLFLEGFAGTGYYRPLVALSLSLDALAKAPVVFHATNLVWHAAAATMTAVVAELFGLPRRAATIAGALFAVHPLGALVASAIAFRSESMLLTFLLVLVWAHRKGRPWLAAGALLAAALTKETGLALAPLIVAALASRPHLRRLHLVEAFAFAIALALRLGVGPSWRASHEPLGTSDAVGTRLASLAKSARAIALPIDRTICDAFPVTAWTAPSAIVGALVLAAVVWLARRRGLGLLFALALLPSLQIAPVMRWWSPHYVYVACSFGAMLLAGAAAKATRAATIAIGCGIAFLAAISFMDGRRYVDDAALWRPEVAKHPACREGHFYLGDVAREQRRWDVAAMHYEAALAPRPRVIAFVDRRAALENLGTVRLEQGRFADAKAAFEQALAGTQEPSARRELTHDLAVTALRSGDADRAARLLEEETARVDALPPSLLVRAMALEQLGREDEARALRARASSTK
jgi:Tfp pilus assembly protein PilF